MDKEDRKEINVLTTRVAGCELTLKEQTKDIEYVALSVSEIRDNHLHTLQKTVEFVKARQEVMFKCIGWGLGFITLVMGILATFIAIGVG